MSLRPSLFDLPPPPPKAMPAGFRYQPDLITAEEEGDLARRFETLDFKPYEHLGYLGNRRVASFGWRRDDTGRMIETGEPIPDFLRPLLDKVAAFTHLPPETFRHALVTEYAPGAGIGWHRDRPPAVAIAGVSLLSPCSFRLRRKTGDSVSSFDADPGIVRVDCLHGANRILRMRLANSALLPCLLDEALAHDLRACVLGQPIKSIETPATGIQAVQASIDIASHQASPLRSAMVPKLLRPRPLKYSPVAVRPSARKVSSAKP